MLKVSFQSLNKIYFGNAQNKDNEPKTQALVETKPDSLAVHKKVEPPTLSRFQSLFTFTITNKQIQQINESGMLPDNLRFVYQDWSRMRGHRYDRPFYMITTDASPLPNKTQFLPEGYFVIRDFYGTPEARKILKPGT